MFAIEPENTESARPRNANRPANTANGVEVSCTAMPMPMSGMSRMAVNTNVKLRPPMRAGRYV